jgi:hypothetical protein
MKAWHSNDKKMIISKSPLNSAGLDETPSLSKRGKEVTMEWKVRSMGKTGVLVLVA